MLIYFSSVAPESKRDSEADHVLLEKAYPPSFNGIWAWHILFTYVRKFHANYKPCAMHEALAYGLGIPLTVAVATWASTARSFDPVWRLKLLQLKPATRNLVNMWLDYRLQDAFMVRFSETFESVVGLIGLGI